METGMFFCFHWWVGDLATICIVFNVFMILLWHYWNCTASTKKKHKKKNEKWGKRWGWTLRVVLSKKWRHVKRDCEVFHGKKNCHIIHSNSLHIEIIKNKVVYKNLHETYACTCNRITIMTEENKRLFTPFFPVMSFLFMVIIDIKTR